MNDVHSQDGIQKRGFLLGGFKLAVKGPYPPYGFHNFEFLSLQEIFPKMIHIVESHLGIDKPGDPTKLYVKLGVIRKVCFLREKG